MGKTEKNKKIVAYFIGVLSATIIIPLLIASDFRGPLKFNYLLNQDTRKTLSLLESLLSYVFYWMFFSILMFGFLMTLTMFLVFFLHRKEDKCLYRKSPQVDDELDFAFNLSQSISFGSTLVLIVLSANNLVNIGGW